MTAPTVDEKRAQALELHLAGATYDQIAQKVGYTDRGNAHRAVQRALDDLGTYTTNDSITTELARLDAMPAIMTTGCRRVELHPQSKEMILPRLIEIQSRASR